MQKPSQNMVKGREHSKGYVILFTVLISSIILAIALGISATAYREVTFNLDARDSHYALFAADSAAECALHHLLLTANNPFRDSITGAWLSDVTITCGEFGGYPLQLRGSTFDTNSPDYVFNINADTLNPAGVYLSKGCGIPRVVQTSFGGQQYLRVQGIGYNLTCQALFVNASLNSKAVERAIEYTFLLDTTQGPDNQNNGNPINGHGILDISAFNPDSLNGQILSSNTNGGTLGGIDGGFWSSISGFFTGILGLEPSVDPSGSSSTQKTSSPSDSAKTSSGSAETTFSTESTAPAMKVSTGDAVTKEDQTLLEEVVSWITDIFQPKGVTDLVVQGPPYIITEAPSEILSNGATLEATVDQNLLSEVWNTPTTGMVTWFEYGIEKDLLSKKTEQNKVAGSTSARQSSLSEATIATSSSGPITITSEVSELDPSTTYYFRACASVASYVACGDTLSFQTLALKLANGLTIVNPTGNAVIKQGAGTDVTFLGGSTSWPGYVALLTPDGKKVAYELVNGEKPQPATNGLFFLWYPVSEKFIPGEYLLYIVTTPDGSGLSYPPTNPEVQRWYISDVPLTVQSVDPASFVQTQAATSVTNYTTTFNTAVNVNSLAAFWDVWQLDMTKVSPLYGWYQYGTDSSTLATTGAQTEKVNVFSPSGFSYINLTQTVPVPVPGATYYFRPCVTDNTPTHLVCGAIKSVITPATQLTLASPTKAFTAKQGQNVTFSWSGGLETWPIFIGLINTSGALSYTVVSGAPYRNDNGTASFTWTVPTSFATGKYKIFLQGNRGISTPYPLTAQYTTSWQMTVSK